MREVELTIQVLEDFDTIIKKVEELGYKLIQEYLLIDHYMIHKSVDLSLDNYEILKNCVLIRKYSVDTDEHILTYKNKTYDSNGKIIFQEKINVAVDSSQNTMKVLESVDFKTLFTIENHSYIYLKDDVEIAIQNVKNPEGIYIEIEATEEELKLNNDELIKRILKEKLDSLNLKNTGDYEVKKAIIVLENMKKKDES